MILPLNYFAIEPSKLFLNLVAQSPIKFIVLPEIVLPCNLHLNSDQDFIHTAARPARISPTLNRARRV